MPIRVDNIVVSDKNIMLLHNNVQYISDIENTLDTPSHELMDDSNLWNIYAEDGKIIHNLFDTSEFDIRTNLIKGSSKKSSDAKDSHENYNMPNPQRYVGICQFYDSAYTVSDYTNDTFTSEFKRINGDTITYKSANGFIRYNNLDSYKNMTDYYISPDVVYTNDGGVQYLTEYPLSQFYNDFGDNESDSTPTMYADSILLKYYLDEKYSVNSYDINETKSRFNNIRTYFGVGNTGNSIYMVFRNNKNGVSEITNTEDENDILNTPLGIAEAVDEPSTNDNVIITDMKSIGYMNNIVTISEEYERKLYFSSTFDADFLEYKALGTYELYDISYIKQPLDMSFIAYFKDTSNTTEIYYLPRTGLEKSLVKFIINEVVDEDKIVVLSDSLLIPTNNNGLLNIWSKNFLYDGDKTLTSFNPFQYAKIGNPNDKSFIEIGVDSPYTNIRPYYNGIDILGIIADYKIDNNGGEDTTEDNTTQIILASTSDNNTYRMGQYFKQIAYPNYEITEVKTPLYSYTDVVTSIPVSSTNTETNETTWSYVLTSIQTQEITGYDTKSEFDYRENSIVDNSRIMFDYSQTNVENELKIGSYMFMQFSNYGLAKLHQSEIYGDSKFVNSTTTGIKNRNIENAICEDIKFSTVSYSENVNETQDKLVDYIGTNSNKNYVYVKSALLATYKQNEDDNGVKYFNSFSVFPLEKDTVSKEPTFTCNDSIESKFVDIEQSPISQFNFIMEKPIPNSMGVGVKYFAPRSANHDASVTLVKWNDEDGEYTSNTNPNYNNPEQTIGGMHLQYNGICTEVYVNGVEVSNNTTQKDNSTYQTSTIYEYPHNCFGDLRTAGTGLPIFESPLKDTMTVDDVFMLNNYLVVKNYAVESTEKNSTSQEISDKIKNSGKVYSYDTGEYPSGGYVVSNFFTNDRNKITSLYSSELVTSSKIERMTPLDSENVHDYNYLWHIKPTKAIEFYPKSEAMVKWKPYYVSKYVDFIKFHNGYYYIALSSSKDKNTNTIGYDIIETDSLFTEKPTIRLTNNNYVSDIRFYDDNVVIEYTDANNNKEVKWFKSGSADSKTSMLKYINTFDNTSPIKHATLKTNEDISADNVRTTYDNVEILQSINRFTSTVNHKSNLFSIKISDLGLEDSVYLSDYQKNNLRTWFTNKITDIVNTVKPANTQLFDVFID